MDSLTRDVRFALKRLAKDRGFLVAALLTLALCVGANAAIFSVVRSVLLRPLPFPESDRVVFLYNSYPNAGAARGSTGVPDWYDRQSLDAFAATALYRQRGMTIGESGSPARVTGMQVTPGFFELLGILPERGRAFGDASAEGTAPREVMLSWGLWQERFAGRADAIGGQLRIDGLDYTVVGVMPRDFLFDAPDLRLWVPVAFTPLERSDERRHSNNFQMIARLRTGATVEQAQAQIDALNAANLERFPELKSLLINAGFHTVVSTLRADVTRDIRSTLILLQAGVLLVLLIGCVNIANLVLVRASARTREIATRLALGAGRMRIARQLLTESVVLGLLGGVLGLGVGRAALALFASLGASELPRGAEIGMDAGVAIFTFALAAVAGLVFGALPVLRLRNADLSGVFREEGRTGTASRRSTTLRGALVTTQVATAFALLVAAGLMFMSFARTLAVDPGFRPDGVLTANIALPVTRYADRASRNLFVDQALERVRGLPGVVAASFGSDIPLTGDIDSSVISPEGYEPGPGESPLSPLRSRVAPGWFEAMGIDIVAGRAFDASDDPDAEPVIIIDEWLARRYWPGEDPIGRIVLDGVPAGSSEPPARMRIIGIAREILSVSLTGDEAAGHYYLPIRQETDAGLILAIRTTAADPSAALTPAVRAAIGTIDPDLPVFDIRTMNERVGESMRTERARAVLLIAFGAVALLLAAIGIYGVLAYAVSLRNTEIGIRIALGSSAGGVFGLVLREGFRWVGAGLAIGLVASVAIGRALQGLLFGVGAADPLVLGAVLAILGAVAVIACVIPARRAALVSPVVALRAGAI